MTVLQYLRSAATAKTIAQIARSTGLTRREVEQAITDLRREGHPIISSSAGCWLSNDPIEVADCARRLRQRYISQAITVRALRRTARRLESREQPTLWPL